MVCMCTVICCESVANITGKPSYLSSERYIIKLLSIVNNIENMIRSSLSHSNSNRYSVH